ncbi:MAG: helix-turn-helix transcriptional regulator [bacterium]
MKDIASRLMRLPQVKSMTGLSKSTIYSLMAEGSFPKQIKIGPRLVAWTDSDIQQWIAHQITAARG